MIDRLGLSSSRSLKLGLIGLGRWGVNYARILTAKSGLTLAAVVTKNQSPTGLEGVFHTHNWRDLLDFPELDGVIIACSPDLHFEMAFSLLSKGLPVIIEKPACYKTDQCLSLMELSLKNNVPCLIDYTHLYSPAYRLLKKKVSQIGMPLVIRSVGLSYGPFRDNVDVLWDWGSHDVAMCLDLLGEMPKTASVNIEHFDAKKTNACIYSLNLEFPSGALSTSRFGNISKKKERLLCVESGKRKWCYDGLSHSVSEFTNNLERFTETIAGAPPLTNLVDEFAEMIRSGDSCQHSLGLAIEVTRVLNAVESKFNDQKGDLSANDVCLL
ncbi:Gfo/Idh/MocA family oxidoreductase [Litoricolaceae bacterium]|nr:Gfo/Idh/MocA family oxidoreductase [Litorivicinaceae bacterium]